MKRVRCYQTYPARNAKGHWMLTRSQMKKYRSLIKVTTLGNIKDSMDVLSVYNFFPFKNNFIKQYLSICVDGYKMYKDL